MEYAIHIPLIYKGKKLGVFGYIWQLGEPTQDDLTIVENFTNKITKELYLLLNNETK
jgi:hypothetical protein